MSQLTDEDTSYIPKDFSNRGLVDEDIRVDVLDHLCSAAEIQNEFGKTLVRCYQSALKSSAARVASADSAPNHSNTTNSDV